MRPLDIPPPPPRSKCFWTNSIYYDVVKLNKKKSALTRAGLLKAGLDNPGLVRNLNQQFDNRENYPRKCFWKNAGKTNPG